MAQIERPAWVRRGTDQMVKATTLLPQFWTPDLAADAAESGALPQIAQEGLREAQEEWERQLAEERERMAAQVAMAEAEASRWHAHALAVEAEARQMGFAAGYADGEAQGAAAGRTTVEREAQAALDRLRSLADQAQWDQQAAIHAAQVDLARLSIAIAQAVIGEHLALAPEALARRVAHLLDRLDDAATATVHLHPDDHAQLQRDWPSFAEERGFADHAPRFIADETIARGGCIIVTRTYYLDARPEVLLAQIAAVFAAAEHDDTMGDER